MATINLTKDTFEDTITENDVVLVDFWAEWCGPCRQFGPTFEKVSEQYPNAVFAKVDTEAEQELAQYFNIRSIPTLMVFREQIGIFNQPGALPEEGLIDLIDQTLALDMEPIKAEVEAHNSEDHEKSAETAAATAD